MGESTTKDGERIIDLRDKRPARPSADWLSAEELAAMTPARLVERATALKPLLAANAREAERLRHPVDAVWSAIRRSGVFYHFVPKKYGGLEYDLQTFIDAMLPLGEGCAATGWVASFCVEHNWMMSQFPEEAQDEIFGSQHYIIAPGVTSPPGKVVETKGGYRLTGRWKWGTGVMHADWILAAGLGGSEEDGSPRILFFIFPAAEATVIDTWHVEGMIGTGSNDIAVEDLFIPAHRCLNMGHMREGRSHGATLYSNPIYRMPMLPFLALTAAIPAVGNARAAIAFFRDQITDRQMYGTKSVQASKASAQMRLARADLYARTAELLLRDVARGLIEVAEPAELTSVAARVSLRAQVAYAMELCRDSVSEIYQAGGARAHMLDNPLQRALRDVNVMSSHIVYDMDGATELHGRALIGLPPNSPMT